MSDVVLRVENLWKEYRLGKIGHRLLFRDLQSGWARFRGREDPNAKIGGSVNTEQLNGANERFWALKDISFDVRQGEVVGIIGRNGAGKSTLLKIISRVTAPTRGSIKIKGRIASLLEVGTGFHPELSGRENIFLNGAILGMNKREIEQKFDEIVKFAEIEKFIDTPVKRYSSGMYVRLAFAVAAHLDPEILVVDEVLAVGDTAFQKKCLGKMGEVAKGGRTVLFVSHNMEAVRRLCHRGIVLEKGNLILNSTTEQSIQYYLNSGQSSVENEIIPDPPVDGTQVFITKIRIEKTDGTPFNGFAVGEKWQVRVFITVNVHIQHFIAAIEIAKMGVALNVSYSAPFYVTPGNYELLFLQTEVDFTPGLYNLSIGLASGTTRTYQKLHNIADIYIENVAISYAEKVLLLNKGCIINQMTIKLIGPKIVS